jgi:hypothetical protein
MVVREKSFLVRALLVIANPAPWLPCLLPFLWIMPCRVGNNTTDYVRIYFARNPY